MITKIKVFNLQEDFTLTQKKTFQLPYLDLRKVQSTRNKVNESFYVIGLAMLFSFKIEPIEFVPKIAELDAKIAFVENEKNEM